MSVKVIKTNVMKMQHVQIEMAIILVLAMMDSWVMVSAVQVYVKLTFETKVIVPYCTTKDLFFFIFLILTDRSIYLSNALE